MADNSVHYIDAMPWVILSFVTSRVSATMQCVILLSYTASLCLNYRLYVCIFVSNIKTRLVFRMSDLLHRDLYACTCTLATDNKANLKDLIASTGLVILLKLYSNRRFFSLCDLEIWWMTPKNNWASLLCYFKLCAAFRSHWWIQTGVTVRKRPI